MTTLEFFNLFLENVFSYIFLLVVIFVIYRLLFWRLVKTVLDPIYFFIIITSSICTTNVVFLAFLGEIKNYYVFSYLGSESLFLFGMLLLAKPQNKLENPVVNHDLVTKLVFGMLLTTVVVLIANLIIFSQRGIPLFLDVRSEASDGGTGFGFISRISQTSTSMFALFYFSKSKLTNLKNNKFEKILFACHFLLGALSGYKAFFIFFIYAYFVSRGRNALPSRKMQYFVISASLIFLIGIFSLILDSTQLDIVLLAFLSRMLASGDVYYMAFVNESITQLPSPNFLFQLFGATLASFKIIDWGQAPLNYGYELNTIVNHSDLGLGPTYRQDLLWLLITGNPLLAAILSFITGLSIGFVNRTVNIVSSINFRYMFLALIYYKSFLLILGPDSAVNDIILTSIILFILFILIELVPIKVNFVRRKSQVTG